MKKFESYVISVNCDDIIDIMDHSHKSVKYKLRREYVIKNLIPSFKDICDVKIFDAITPNDFVVNGDRVLYKDFDIKRGIDRNYNIYCNEYQNSISIGFFVLYKKSIEYDINLLIMEDDAVLPIENVKNIKKCIDDFIKIDHPSILYLQSECPWMDGFPIRKFPPGVLSEHSENLNRILPSWYDIAGNTCFMINPAGSFKMIELINNIGMFPADQLTTIAMNSNLIEVYIPKDNENMILLNKKLQ
jgi:GR25 family glycosyltransferase involved in LPS biosynthesis